MTEAVQPMDLETFYRQAKYPLVKFTDMTAEMKEEAMDICITAVEKYPADMEKCTQVAIEANSLDVVANKSSPRCRYMSCCR